MTGKWIKEGLNIIPLIYEMLLKTRHNTTTSDKVDEIALSMVVGLFY